MSVDYLVGDTREVIAKIPDGSVSFVATSPPFYHLRSYLQGDHADKGNEIGSELSAADFLDILLELTAEWWRVLAPWGSIAVELGDTYSGARGYGSIDSPNPAYAHAPKHEGHFDGRTAKNFKRKDDGSPRAKSLMCIPQLYAIALAYGINPLTGKESPAGKCLVRNVICWARPNPAVWALGDKVRPSTSYIVVATRSAKRWFDLTAVRSPLTEPDRVQRRLKGSSRSDGWSRPQDGIVQNEAGAPPLDAWFDEYDSDLEPFHDTWTLTTQPSSLAHFAMWPSKLAERLILMMCPREVCRVCSKPRRRVEGTTRITDGLYMRGHALAKSATNGATFASNGDTERETLGWSDCGHDDHRPGLVLDPFAGSGTTGAVADLHGRDAVLIDIDERNRDLYPARYDECKRALYGTPAPDHNQMELAL